MESPGSSQDDIMIMIWCTPWPKVCGLPCTVWVFNIFFPRGFGTWESLYLHGRPHTFGHMVFCCFFCFFCFLFLFKSWQNVPKYCRESKDIFKSLVSIVTVIPGSKLILVRWSFPDVVNSVYLSHPPSLFTSHSRTSLSSPVISISLPGVLLFSSPRRSLLSFSLWGWFPRRRPRWPLPDPGPELANPLSERREDGALLQEGLCWGPPPWHRWR